MAVVTAANMSLAFGDREILADVSLAIADGERVGLVGGNGEGKSSLARILAGDLEADTGDVVVANGAALAYLPQQPRFADAATPRDVVTAGLARWAAVLEEYTAVTEALAAGTSSEASLIARQAALAAEVDELGGWDQDYRVEEICQQLKVPRLDDPLSQMSGGERRRTDLARVLVAQPDLAIFDEPTNHLDIETIEWLEEFLVNEHKGALLLITHDRYFLDRVVTRTIELAHGALHSYDGGWEAYLISKAERAAHEARSESNRQNLLRRELDWLRRSPKARTTKSKSRIKRANVLIDTDRPAAERHISPILMERKRSGKTAFELKGLVVNVGGETLIDGLDLVVRDGERLGLVGPNGVGKTSLLRVLLGNLDPAAGEVRIAHNTSFAYLDQERGELDDDRSIMENVCSDREHVEVGGLSISTHAYLSRFLFDGSKQRQKVSSLSGGERARVQLAKFLLEPANCLLLDEPTNDLDVATLSALEEFLVEAGVTVLFVTHDRYFLDRVADAVLAYEGEGLVTRYEGSYQAFRHNIAAKKSRRSEEQVTNEGPSSLSKAKTKRKAKSTGLTFTEKHELENIVALIDEAEAEVARLDARLLDPSLYKERGNEVKALQAQANEARELLDRRIARWEELESKRA